MEEINKNSSEILKQEFEYIQNHPNTSTGCTAGLFNQDDYYNWKISLFGPKDSIYAGGLFFLKLSFPKDYPNNPPQINFLTPIYHLNVCPIKGTKLKETLGHVKENIIIFSKYNLTVKEILTKLYAIFYVHNPTTPYLSERASEYRKNRVLFELKAQYFTKLYANSDKINNDINISNENWDFSVNKYFLIFKDLFAQTFLKVPNTIHIDENNISDEIIDLNFIINGIDEKKFKCKKNELTEDALKNFLKEIGKEEDPEKFLFIFGLRRLILEVTIGENGLRNNHYITMISDFKIS